MGCNGHYLSQKAFRDIDIPPRKLLGRRATDQIHIDIPSRKLFGRRATDQIDLYSDYPRSDETRFQKFLPCNNGDSDSNENPYSSDEFRMYEFKVRRCTRGRSHDWTDCPFAHPGEKALRRDPRKFRYTGDVCAEFRKGNCSRGDNCEFSHGVFECWLHPARYRTEACKDGKKCKRKVCFFAHTSRQFRVLPLNCNDNSLSSQTNCNSKVRNCNHCNHSCVYCQALTTSPTSILMGFPQFSPTNSPPLSPVKSGFSPVSRFGDRINRMGCQNVSYEEAVIELMASLEAMNMKESVFPSTKIPRWVDVNFNGDEQQQQFVPSPSTPNPSGSNFFNGDDKFGEYGLTGPDIGWVNDLLT